MWLAIINNPFTRVLASIGLFMVFVLMLIAYGGSRERAKAASRTLKTVAKARSIENEVNGLNDTDLRRRAGKWVRPSR